MKSAVIWLFVLAALVAGGALQTLEGQNINPQLLEQVSQILLKEEGIGGVVGIDLEGVRPAIQIAEFAFP